MNALWLGIACALVLNFVAGRKNVSRPFIGAWLTVFAWLIGTVAACAIAAFSYPLSTSVSFLFFAAVISSLFIVGVVAMFLSYDLGKCVGLHRRESQ